METPETPFEILSLSGTPIPAVAVKPVALDVRRYGMPEGYEAGYTTVVLAAVSYTHLTLPTILRV